MRWLLIIALILAPVVGYMAWRTHELTAVERQAVAAAPAPAHPIAVDVAGAAKRLSEAIQLKTIAGPDGAPLDPEPYRRLTEWMATSYPALTEAAKREQVNDYSLLYTWSGADAKAPPILLVGHLDVPAPEPGAGGAMFSGAVRSGAVWGRGAQIGKGPLVSMLEAANALAAGGFKPRRTIIFAFGQDGAAGGEAGAAQLARVLAARNIKAWFALGEGPAISAAQYLTGKPAAMIGVAEKRDLHLLVTASTQPGDPPAVTQVAQAIVALDAMPTRTSLADEPTRSMIRALIRDAPYWRAFAIANSWAFGPLIRMQMRDDPGAQDLMATTLSANVIEGGANQYMRPTEAMAMINVGLHPRDTPGDILARARAVVSVFPDVKVDWAARPGPASPISSDTSDAYRLISSLAAAASDGATVAPCLYIHATDARLYAPAAENVYRFTPALLSAQDVNDAAGSNEHLSQRNLARMIEFYQRLLAEGAK